MKKFKPIVQIELWDDDSNKHTLPKIFNILEENGYRKISKIGWNGIFV